MGKIAFAKRDVVVVFVCAVFLLVNLGAVGSRGRRRAKEAVCISNLKRWGVVWFTFANDNGGFFMDRGGSVSWLETMLENYGSSLRPNIWLCPEARRPYHEGGRNPHMAWDDSNYNIRGSYGINLWVAKGHTEGGMRSWSSPWATGAQDGPLMIDSQWKDMQPFPGDVPLQHETDIWTPNAQEMQRACVNRHNGVNAVFLDGSVKKVGLKHLWRLKWNRDWPDDYPLPDWPQWMQNFKDPQ
jgi:prepilin-type processing-associated H-X9-DG protein